MTTVYFDSTFEAWRDQARRFLSAGVRPRDLVWKSSRDGQGELIDDALPMPAVSTSADTAVPKAFLALAQTVSFHRDQVLWEILYRVLWRLKHEDRNLLAVLVDDDVRRLYDFEKAIRRDAHKMKAFVRFRPAGEGDDRRYVAWYRPDNPIVRYVAPFFARRFAAMSWSILTPDESAHWNGETLTYAEGTPSPARDSDDGIEDLWRHYYRSIFNPARIKVKAMKREMPVRFWANLPESREIAELLRQHEGRTDTMVEHRARSAKNYLPAMNNLSSLRSAAEACEGCPLHRPATQTVFGEGPVGAELFLVGEQPGDEEDRLGRLFVGPAGRVLDEAIMLAGLSRSELYLTNAVKHFKYRPMGTRRLHARPRSGEVGACEPWVRAEVQAVGPKLIVCLGATAALSMMGRLVQVTKERGHVFPTGHGVEALVTFHPAAALRAGDGEKEKEIFDALVEDLKTAARYLATVQKKGSEA